MRALGGIPPINTTAVVGYEGHFWTKIEWPLTQVETDLAKLNALIYIAFFKLEEEISCLRAKPRERKPGAKRAK